MSRGKPPALLIFGEDDNDRLVLSELVQALRPESTARIERRRDPIIVTRNRDEARRKKQTNTLARQVERDQQRFEVKAVLVHEDCDAVEPAHEARSAAIERDGQPLGVPVVPATPAWETEAWLFLWPDAAPMVVKGWSRPSRTKQRVGLIEHAKEEYRRAVAKGAKTTRAYEESDAPKIVAKAREAGLISAPDATSHSFDRFCARLRALKL